MLVDEKNSICSIHPPSYSLRQASKFVGRGHEPRLAEVGVLQELPVLKQLPCLLVKHGVRDLAKNRKLARVPVQDGMVEPLKDMQRIFSARSLPWCDARRGDGGGFARCDA